MAACDEQVCNNRKDFHQTMYHPFSRIGILCHYTLAYHVAANQIPEPQTSQLKFEYPDVSTCSDDWFNRKQCRRTGFVFGFSGLETREGNHPHQGPLHHRQQWRQEDRLCPHHQQHQNHQHLQQPQRKDPHQHQLNCECIGCFLYINRRVLQIECCIKRVHAT